MLTFRNVTKTYRSGPDQSNSAEQIVINNVSFSAEDGKTLVLIGPSGSGKSTILRLIMGLITPTAGSISIGNAVFKTTAPNATILRKFREQVGYVIQNGGLFPHLTARQNLELRPKILGWPQDKTQSRIAELSELTRTPKEILDQYPYQLSGGQAQRIGLMRALMLDPPILLLDEPLGALDPIIRFELQEELQNIFHRLAKTVIMVTHDLTEAAFFGNSIVLLKDGKVLQQGTIAEFSKNPEDPFVTKFMNAQRNPFQNFELKPS